jgi:hypothetical protein
MMQSPRIAQLTNQHCKHQVRRELARCDLLADLQCKEQESQVRVELGVSGRLDAPVYPIYESSRCKNEDHEPRTAC